MITSACALVFSRVVIPDTCCTLVPSCMLTSTRPPPSSSPSRVTPFLGASFVPDTLRVSPTI